MATHPSRSAAAMAAPRKSATPSYANFIVSRVNLKTLHVLRLQLGQRDATTPDYVFFCSTANEGTAHEIAATMNGKAA